jgi:oxygen-independent coproporphyrinogen-3 oxidase
VATRRHRAPEPWAERVERVGHGSTAEEELPAAARAREMLLMGLRLTEGIDLSRFAARTGMPLIEAVDDATLQAAIEAGYLALSDTGLQTLPEGRLRLDALLARLVC